MLHNSWEVTYGKTRQVQVLETWLKLKGDLDSHNPTSGRAAGWLPWGSLKLGLELCQYSLRFCLLFALTTDGFSLPKGDRQLPTFMFTTSYSEREEVLCYFQLEKSWRRMLLAYLGSCAHPWTNHCSQKEILSPGQKHSLCWEESSFQRIRIGVCVWR